MDAFTKIIERVKNRAAAGAILAADVIAIVSEESLSTAERKPVAWLTPNDWGGEPLVTSTKSVVDAWMADNRRVTPLFE